MRAAVRPLSPWTVIVTSPLRRCAEFAAELAGEIGIDHSQWPDFQEMAFGEWEGRTADSLLHEQREAIEAFWRDPVEFSPPGGEGLVEFSGRIEEAWNKLVDQHAGEHVLLVAHGGVIRVILARALGMPLPNLFRIDVPYACMTRLQVNGRGDASNATLLSHGGS